MVFLNHSKSYSSGSETFSAKKTLKSLLYHCYQINGQNHIKQSQQKDCHTKQNIHIQVFEKPPLLNSRYEFHLPTNDKSGKPVHQKQPD